MTQAICTQLDNSVSIKEFAPQNPPKPFVKWAGGKRQLLPEIKKYIPNCYSDYYEPFIGGGAVLFFLQPERFVINDVSSEIINVYRVIKNNVYGLINELKSYKNESEFYYKVRALDREEGFSSLSNIEKAARTIYLNKTCFNGLFRVNRQGQFNTPFGNYKKPNIVSEENLLAVHRFFQNSYGGIMNTDFEVALKNANAGSFIYLDPPYDPVSPSSSFTSYTLSGFDRQEQQRLKSVCDDLDRKGCKFLLSNSATNFIKELYRDYKIEIVQAKRNINSKVSKRGKIEEVLIRNYH